MMWWEGIRQQVPVLGISVFVSAAPEFIEVVLFLFMAGICLKFLHMCIKLYSWSRMLGKAFKFQI